MIHNILVIRFRRVGDSVLSMALCHSLKLTFPNARVHFVINKGIAPLYENHPDIDRVIPFSDRELHGLTYLKKVWAIVRHTRYDAIIDMRSTLKTLPFALFSLRSPYRIGRRKWYNRFVHNYRLTAPDGYNRVQGNLHLMTPLASETKLVQDETFRLYITPEETALYRDYLVAQGLDLGRPVMLVAVATRIVGKAWPHDRMTEVLRRVLDHFPTIQMVFNYSGDVEAAEARRFYDDLGQDSRIFLNIEAKGLRQLCALCQASTFFFGNEGGPRHISQAFNVPSFAIYPPGIDKAFWLPAMGDQFQGISPDDTVPPAEQAGLDYAGRMALITVENVWAGLSAMLHRFLPA